MSTVVITIDGVDVTSSVIFRDAEFTSASKGAAGTARFRVRDLNHSQTFVTGKELLLTIDGIRKWGGYVQAVHRGYFWDGSPQNCGSNLTPRYLMIEGADYSVLLNKRVLYDKVDGTKVKLTCFAAGTTDQTVIDYYVANHTDLPADGVTTTLVEHVGTPAVDTCLPNQCNISGSASWTVNQFLRFLNFSIGAVWYIDPNKNLVWTDVDTPNAPVGISDQPSAGQVGCRDLKISSEATEMINDAMVWGAGQGPSQQILFSRVQDAPSETLHGVWQKGLFNQPILCQSTADRIANSYVFGSPAAKRGGKDDRVSIQCTVFDPRFTVAQKVPITSAVFGYSDVVPIRSQRITFPTPTDPKYELTLGFDIDDPWTTVEFFWPPFTDFKCPDGSPPPCVPIFPPPPGCTDQVCAPETFSRTVSVGWGISTLGGLPWVGGTNQYFSVNGQGIFTGSPTTQNTGINFLTGGTSAPFESLVNLTIPAGGPGMVGGIRFNDSGGGFYYVQFTREAGTTLKLDTLGHHSGGATGSGSVTGFIPGFGGQPLFCRLRIDQNYHVKVWKASDPEPAAWTSELTLSGAQGALTALTFFFGANSIPVTFTSVEIPAGYLCGGSLQGGSSSSVAYKFLVPNADTHPGDPQYVDALSHATMVNFVSEYFGSPLFSYRTSCNLTIGNYASWERYVDVGGGTELRGFMLVSVPSISNVTRAKIDFDPSANYWRTQSAAEGPYVVQTSRATIGLFADAPNIGTPSSPVYLPTNVGPSLTPYAIVEAGQWFDISSHNVWVSPLGMTNVGESLIGGPTAGRIDWESGHGWFAAPPGYPSYDPWVMTIEYYPSRVWVPCSAPTSGPDNTCLPTYKCENLTQIPTPPNQPDTYTYWATAKSQQSIPGSSEVWVNGLRVRVGLDYDEAYTQGYFQLHPGIATAASKLRACYYTACFLIA